MKSYYDRIKTYWDLEVAAAAQAESSGDLQRAFSTWNALLSSGRIQPGCTPEQWDKPIAAHKKSYEISGRPCCWACAFSLDS